MNAMSIQNQFLRNLLSHNDYCTLKDFTKLLLTGMSISIWLS
jgi:hypothetical protein